MTKAYHNGPIPGKLFIYSDGDRKKTDVVCLIIFLVFNIVMLGIAIYSWTNGKFSKLTTPYDPDGKGCGVDYPNYPYIYFASPHYDVKTKLFIVVMGHNMCKKMSNSK